MMTVDQLLKMLHDMPLDGVIEIKEHSYCVWKTFEFEAMQVVTQCYKEDVDLKENTDPFVPLAATEGPTRHD